MCTCVCDIWAALEEENTPSDTLAIVELQKQLMTLKLKSDEDPNKYIVNCESGTANRSDCECVGAQVRRNNSPGDSDIGIEE